MAIFEKNSTSSTTGNYSRVTTSSSTDSKAKANSWDRDIRFSLCLLMGSHLGLMIGSLSQCIDCVPNTSFFDRLTMSHSLCVRHCERSTVFWHVGLMLVFLFGLMALYKRHFVLTIVFVLAQAITFFGYVFYLQASFIILLVAVATFLLSVVFLVRLFASTSLKQISLQMNC